MKVRMRYTPIHHPDFYTLTFHLILCAFAKNCVTPSFPMCSVCENGRFKTETLNTVCEQAHQMALDYAN